MHRVLMIHPRCQLPVPKGLSVVAAKRSSGNQKSAPRLNVALKARLVPMEKVARVAAWPNRLVPYISLLDAARRVRHDGLCT